MTGSANNETFTDVFIWDYATGDARVIAGFKFGVGTVPVENFHYAKNTTSGRAVAKFENSNTTGGSTSESAALQFAGNTSNWTIGNDFGLNGGDNWFIQGSSLSMFGTDTGVVVGGGSTIADSEVFRCESTTGGLLLPRMTTTQRNALGGKNAGLLIWNSTDTQVQVWNGSAWAGL